MEVKPPVSLVTGATGFLGSHLVDQLLARGHEVHVLLRKNSNLRWLIGKPVQFHYGDVEADLKGLHAGLHNADYCFHVAGVIAARRPQTYYQVNTIGTDHVLNACLQHPSLKRIVVVTSLAARGPRQEPGPAQEADECHPITDYGKSKRDAELVAMRYQDRLPITIIRPPAIYGPRDIAVLQFFKIAKWGVFPLPAGGGRMVNMAHALDVVQGIILAAEQPKAVGETFYVGEDKNYTWEEAAQWIGHSVHKKLLLLPIPKNILYGASYLAELYAILTQGVALFNRGQARNFCQKNWTIDISKAKQLLGFQPKYTLKTGTEETAAWYQAEKWL